MSTQQRAFRSLAAPQVTVVTGTSQAVTLNFPVGTNAIRMHAKGSADIFVLFSEAATPSAATNTNGICIPAGSIETFTLAKGVLSYSVIADATGTTLYSIQGEGIATNSGSNDAAAAAAMTATTGSKTGGTAAASSTLVGGAYNTTLPTLTNGQQASLQLGLRGNLGIQIGDPTGTSYATVAGSNTDNISVSTVGALYTQGLLRLFNGTGWDRWRGTTIGAAMVAKPETTGGTSGAKIIAAASTNATSVKASSGQVFGIELANNAAYAVFLKLYNKASAPTVGTDTPVRTIQIPAGGRCEINRPLGFAFSTGIAYAITKLVADADITAVAADDLVGSIDYA